MRTLDNLGRWIIQTSLKIQRILPSLPTSMHLHSSPPASQHFPFRRRVPLDHLARLETRHHY